MQGWVFAQAAARRSPNNPNRQHAGQALLALVTPYFEMVNAYHEGRASRRGEATEFLKRGIEIVFGSDISVDAVNRFVSEVRNGLFHELIFRTVVLHERAQGLPRFGIVSTAMFGGVPPFDLLVIDPYWVADQAQQHFATYVARLRAPALPADHDVAAHFRAFMAIRKSRTT